MITEHRSNSFVIWLSLGLSLVFIILGSIFLASPSKESLVQITSKINEDDWVKGSRDASVILVEYSDFQCPACASYYPMVKKVAEEFGDRIAVVYRHFPLPIHQHAKVLSNAAEAAGKQGKFWEMHDLIFENQIKLTSKSKEEVQVALKDLAASTGINTEDFLKDLDSEEIKNKVEASYKTATDAGINSTPSFFINGTKISNPKDFDSFKILIEEELNKTAPKDQ